MMLDTTDDGDHRFPDTRARLIDEAFEPPGYVLEDRDRPFALLLAYHGGFQYYALSSRTRALHGTRFQTICSALRAVKRLATVPAQR